jgi:dTMP kinase
VEHVRVRRLLTGMAAAEPHRYVVVEADGDRDEVAARALAAVLPLLPRRGGAGVADPTGPDQPTDHVVTS